MTAEIAVMNRQAVALAADSAVTVTGDQGVKIFASANKIFALSKYHPVGFMVYGNASLMGTPWETVAKVFRAEIGDSSFPHLPDYAEAFLHWVGRTPMFTSEMKQRFVAAEAGAILSLLRERIERSVASRIQETGEVTMAQVKSIAREETGNIEQFIQGRPDRPIDQAILRRVQRAASPAVDQAIPSIFENLPLTKALQTRLRRIALAPLSKSLRRAASGIVFAGFGDEDYMPRLIGYEIDGVIETEVVMSDYIREADISHRPDEEAYVSGFAQSDVIHLFMEGVLPQYEDFVEGYLGKVIDRFEEVLSEALPDDLQAVRERLNEAREELHETYTEELRDHRFESSIEPILDVVASLPVDELAALAESLVNLTSLKRRISHDQETVGGPVDVAVISKGDGLIWIKRKHYFQPELNQHFFANYYRRGRNDQDEGQLGTSVHDGGGVRTNDLP